MLSVANPPDPPCSYEALALKSDERTHPPERQSSLEADPTASLDEAERPPFSIRDYVFASRSKDFGTNWPFPQQHLQFCLKHGIRVLLPPFEPPDLVRARFRRKCTQTEHLTVCSEAEGTQPEVDLVGSNPADLLDGESDALKHDFSLPIHKPVLGSPHHLQNPPSEDKSIVVQAVGSEDRLAHGEAKLKVAGHDHTRKACGSVSETPGSVQATRSGSESSSEVQVAIHSPWTGKVGSLCEQSAKKCRLIVKFGGAPELNRTEYIVSNLSSVSDPMATKVCPVCKTFSSTSNTTLNAHIDQCLSVESSAKRVAIKLAQHKVKPRKKRSMEDICATAPRCTLEDLDRRNGTNWALESTFIAQNNETACTKESKRERNSPPKPTDDKRGAVYVDSNGTKLLILSKFNDAPPAAVVDCPGQKEFRKEWGGEMGSPFGKKKTFSPTYRRYLKAKGQRKKMSSFNHLKGKIHKGSKFPVNTRREEETISWVSNAQGQKAGKPGTLGQWICSKRSRLLKHLNSKFNHKKPRNSLTISHQTSMEGDQSASCDFSVPEGCRPKFCRSSDEVLSSKKVRMIYVPSSDALATGIREKCSASLPEKNDRSKGNNSSTSNSRPVGNHGSSVKSKRVEIHAKSKRFLNSTETSVDCHSQVHKAKRGSRRSLLMDECPMETIKCNEVMQGVVYKKLRKRRFVEEACEEVDNLPLELIERCDGPPGVHDLGSVSNNIVSGMHQSKSSENIVMSETSDTFEHTSPCQSKTRNSSQDDTQCHASDRSEYLTLNNSQQVADCCHTEAIEFDAQTEVSTHMESMIKYLSEISDGSSGSKMVVSENHKAAISERLDSCPSLGHPGETISANEATTVASTPKLLGDHVMRHDVISSDVNRESSVIGDYHLEIQNNECQADVASIQVSGACLTIRGEKVLGHGIGSSMTLSQPVAAQIHNMVADREPSGSPVSATSTISHLSVEDFKSCDVEQEPSEEHVVIQEIPRPGSRNMGLLANDSMKGTKRTYLEKMTQKMKAVAFSQELGQFWHSQPCCCSRRENISHKPKILRQSVMAGMMLPTKTKQMTSTFYVRPDMPSFRAYSHSRSEATSAPILNSPPDSISGRAPPGFSLRFPTFHGSASPSTQPQATSTPVLRLMGKNLMVMNREEKPAQQKNQVAPCSSEDTSDAKDNSLLGLTSTGSFSNKDDSQYHPHQLLEGSMLIRQLPSNILAPIPLPEGTRFAGTLLHSELKTKTDSHGDWNTSDMESSFLGVYDSDKVCPNERQKAIPVSRAPVPETEVIVIDDSPEHEVEPSGNAHNPTSTKCSTFSGLDVRRVRAVPCYPSQNLFQSRELGRDVKPGYPMSYQPTSANTTKWGSTSGSSGLLQRTFVVPSLSPGTLCYSPNFQ